MAKKPSIKHTSKSNKIISTTSGMLGTKASERKRISAPGKKESTDWQSWWLCDENDIGSATETIILKIENEQSIRYTSFINWARLYGNWEAMSWGANILNNTHQDSDSENPLRLNLIQSVIDACASKIAKDFPQPYIITTGASSYYDKLKAEKMTKAVKGVFQSTKTQEKSVSQFRDSCVYGTGGMYYYSSGEEIIAEWVPAFEIRVADMDGINKDPRSLHRVNMISRDKLIAMFPDKEELIADISTNPANRLRDSNNIVDMVRVKRSWHLPSKKKAKDGVYAVTVNDKCLLKESYDDMFFPIDIHRWYDRPLGFWGRSITEEVYSVQMSLDDLLTVASQSYSLIGMPVWTVPDGAEIPEDIILTNFIARMIPYRGNTPPTVMTPEPLPASFFQWVSQHIAWVFQIVGLSQTSATGNNQLGPDASGTAIRELVDIETSRFTQVSTAWENSFINKTRIILSLMKKIANKNKDYKIQYTENKQNRELVFADIDLDNYDIGVDVVSQAPDRVAGRIQTINDFVQRNWIDQDDGMESQVLDPDLQEIVKLQISSKTLVEKCISEMVEFGTPSLPEPYLENPQKQYDLSKKIYNMLVCDGCPDERLQLVRNWIDALAVMIQPQQMQQQVSAQPAPNTAQTDQMAQAQTQPQSSPQSAQ